MGLEIKSRNRERNTKVTRKEHVRKNCKKGWTGNGMNPGQKCKEDI